MRRVGVDCEGLIESCGLYAHCVPSATPGNAYCMQDSCAAGALLCDANVAKVCAADGTIPQKGSDCGDEVCEAGVCKPAVCEPSELSCEDGDVYSCVALGTGTQLSATCGAGTACFDAGELAACRTLDCTSGAAGVCVGNQVGKCATDGFGLSQVTDDCAATQKVCTALGVCSATAVDTAGIAEQADYMNASELFGVVVDVHSDRKLTKLEANLLLEAPRDLRWVVYEETSAGSYQLKTSEITTNNNGSSFFATSTLTWGLQAGKRYMVGVGLVVGDGYGYYDQAAVVPSALSFGHVVGGTRFGFDANNAFLDTSNNVYQVRATTTSP